MASVVEKKLLKIPVLRTLVQVFQRIKLPWLEGLSFYDLIELYIRGIVEGGLTYHASAVAFSFFMALFPFLLFILTLIPFVPIEGFQSDFLFTIQKILPPNTADSVDVVINDIINNRMMILLLLCTLIRKN